MTKITRDSFIFYRSFYEASLPLNKEQKADLFTAICELALNQNVTKTEPLVNALLTLIKPNIDANNIRYANGMKGGRPKTKVKPKRNQGKTKAKPNEDVNVNVDVDVNGNENIKEKLDKKKPENFEQLAQFVTEKNLASSDAEWLWHKWQGNGWTNGNKPILCWKSTIRSWKAGKFFPSQKAITSESSEIERLAL